MSLNIQLDDDIDVLGVLYDFIVQFCYPPYNPDNIYRAYQNRSHPPEDNDDFAVITPISTSRRCSNVELFDGNRTTSTELLLAEYQIDCYSSFATNARHRAQSLENFLRSSIGIEFLRRNGVGVTYFSGAQDNTLLDLTEQYTPRWTVSLQVCYNSNFSYEQEWFDEVNVDIVPSTATDDDDETETDKKPLFVTLENVDIHHEPV